MAKHSDRRSAARAAETAAAVPRRPKPYPTPPPTPPRRHRSWLAATCITLAILLAGAAGVTYVISPNWGKHNPSAAARNVGKVPTVHGKLVGYISPSLIEIPKIDARAPIVKVGTQHRELDIPLNPRVVGWWDGGAKPGERTGTAILAGHINYAGVSGPLATINRLNPGDSVFVTGLHSGHRVKLKFSITGVRTYRKTALPYQQIFDQKSVGRLAIVTCGGPFDAGTGNYEDNIVAFAVPA